MFAKKAIRRYFLLSAEDRHILDKPEVLKGQLDRVVGFWLF